MYFTLKLMTRFFLINIVLAMMVGSVFGQTEKPSGIMGEISKTEVSNSQNLNKIVASLPIPQMIYPADGTTGVPIIPQFILSTVIGADRYEIQVANDNDFSCGLFSCSILSNSWWQFDSETTSEYKLEWFPGITSSQSFKNNSIYYWRVRAQNTSSGEQSDWSQTFRYTTTSSGYPVSQPSLLSPITNTTVPWMNIELKWNKVSNATWYQIQWSTSNSFNSFFYQWTRGDSPSLIINVKPKTTYYWRVIAFNDKSVSTFSSTRTFQTGTQVTLTNPTGTLDDGSGTDNYDDNLDVFWLIKPTNALPNSKIKLSFLLFDIEDGYDFVTIYDGETTSSPVLKILSGTSIPESILSSGPTMLVRFTSDAHITRKGWNAKYESSWKPTAKEISDYIDQLSLKYKVPSVIVKAVAEQESGWRQFYEDGTPVFHNEIDANGNVYAKGWGLMQVTVPVNVEKTSLVLATNIREGVKQGENNFTVDYAQVEIDIELLKYDWRYNLEIGTRILAAKKVAPESFGGSGGAEDDASILENWYYPLAYYNGAVRDGANDPKLNYTRNAAGWKDKSVFPYQECIYNIIAQKYSIPKDHKMYFGFPIIVTLPGPDKVKIGDGHYEFVHPDFCFFDWAVYYRDGSVKIGNGGGKNNGCIPDYKPYPGQVIHIVPLGSPGITVVKTISNIGAFNFSSTGNQTALAIDFKSISGAGSCTVDFISNEANQLGFVGNAPQNISPYRWVISQEGLASFNAELKFDLSELPIGISNPSLVKIYSRSSAGLGLFTELPTIYDATRNTLSASVTSFSEFIFGSDGPLTNVEEKNQIPNNYTLYQNYPNPFNPSTTIKFSIPVGTTWGDVPTALKVYDVLGREVVTLVNEEKAPGEYSVEFRAQSLPSGVYFYKLRAGDYTETKKMVLMK